MKTISRAELKTKLDQHENFKLVFTLGDWHYRAKHIPGSIQVDNPEKAKELLDKEDDIVVYCSNVHCVASIMAFHLLEENGFKNTRRYAGGIQDWEEAGYPLEGELVDRKE